MKRTSIISIITIALAATLFLTACGTGTINTATGDNQGATWDKIAYAPEAETEDVSGNILFTDGCSSDDGGLEYWPHYGYEDYVRCEGCGAMFLTSREESWDPATGETVAVDYPGHEKCIEHQKECAECSGAEITTGLRRLGLVLGYEAIRNSK